MSKDVGVPATEVYRMVVENVVGRNRVREITRWYVRLNFFGEERVLAISAKAAERLVASGLRQGPDR